MSIGMGTIVNEEVFNVDVTIKLERVSYNLLRFIHQHLLESKQMLLNNVDL
jgi:hypothetical protein